ncbi:MAG: SDR family NAD(P)-dependent oxidoreductase, partial [Bacteroidetes bacterium]|nr:SDR family NAD(P)-dependent oxidoreductase [Bacteroidota bacterium]
VVHATRRLDTTLGNIQELLASEGVLMLLEVTNSPVYLDFIFGMTEGWWLFEDTRIRKEHATMVPEKWKQVLEKLNYSDVACYSDFENNDSSCQTVIMAKSRKLRMEVKVSPNGVQKQKTNWLVFADKSGVSEKIIKKLNSQNKNCVVVHRGKRFDEVHKNVFEIDAKDQEGADQVIDSVTKKGNFEGIVYAWGLDSVPNDKVNAESISRCEEETSIMMMNIMRKLNSTNYEKNPSIWMLLSGTQSINNSPEMVNLSQEGLRGVCRVIVNEFPVFKSTVVDFSSPVQDEEIDEFVKEIEAEDNVDELAFRGRQRFVLKLERLTMDAITQKAKRLVPAEGSAYHATMSEYGVLDNLILRETMRKVPMEDEVEVTVKASALNFRDIMIAMGLLSDAAVEGGLFGRTFGLECAGVVSKVGKKVKKVKVGDEVMATAPSCLSGFAYPKAAHVVKKPKRLSWSEAASLPVVYTTAYFSLIYHCRIQKGEKILIHAAAGGVGIAAVHIANAIGAEVFATCGSQDKINYLKKIGVKPDHILNSRTLEFSDRIMELTNGEGVDIVLNSLSGEAIYKSVQCLSAYGRFVEIGKTDIYRNSKLGLQPFGNNLSYFGVDVDRLFKQKVEFGGSLFQESIDFFVKNKFPAHPVTIFPIDKLADAFQYMGGARHIGKIIVSMEGDVEVAPSEEIRFKANGTYLLTGGASGFGLSVANWMTTKGCRHLVLMSRSGPKTDEEKVMVRDMKKRGINVMLAKGDVSKKEDVSRIFKEIKKSMPPLKGIQHAAMVLDDASIPEIDEERYMKVFKPKAVGCWLLHKETEKMNLDHFVLYSSISAVYGNPGQVSYVGGSSFLDNFSSWRRQKNLPSTTINWGVIGDVGFVARSGKVGGLLYKQGWKTFTLDEATWILEQMLLNNPVQRVATDSDWEMIGNFYTHSAKSSRFEHLVKEKELGMTSGGGAGDGALKATILESDEGEQHDILLDQLRETFARVLGTIVNKVNINEPVTKYGLDSLMANQIRNWIQSNLAVDYSMMKIMRGPTIDEMTGQIIDELTGAASGEGEGTEKSELDKWIIRTRKVENPRVRLFCFPYFAGGASVFSNWNELLPDDIEVCAVQFPGREERGDEKSFDNVPELIKALAEVIEPLLTSQIAFYAHSSGAAVALELTRYLKKKHGKIPTRFIVGGWRAPHMESEFKFLDKINAKEVYLDKNIPNIKGHLRALEIPEEVIGNQSVFNEMLPSLRADILMGKNYKYKEEEPMTCSLTAVAGKSDHVFTVDQIKGWAKHTSGEFSYKEVTGGHLFCRDNKEELLQMISEELAVMEIA